MKRSYRDIHQELLDNGTFFDHFPKLSGVYSIDKEEFKRQYKEKFSVKPIPSFQMKAEDIVSLNQLNVRKVKGVQPSISNEVRKTRLVDLVVKKIKLALEIYNMTCEKGFEITVEDLINHFKSTRKEEY